MLSIGIESAREKYILQNMNNYLRRVYTKSTGLSNEEQSYLLKQCLAEQFRQIQATGSDAEHILRKLSIQFGGEHKRVKAQALPVPVKNIPPPVKAKSGDVAEIKVSKVKPVIVDNDSLQKIIAIMFNANDKNQSHTEPDVKVGQVIDVLEKLRDKFGGAERSLIDCLANIDQMMGEQYSSVEHATQASFDRLIKSLDPDLHKQMIEKKKFESTKTYKAHLFDLLSEKYIQFKQYHEKGMFVKDCREVYRSKMKKYGL